MTQRIYVIPRPGLVVRDPAHGDHLPPGGRHVQETSYWRRRRDDGDVTFGKPAAKAPAKPATATAPAKEPGK